MKNNQFRSFINNRIKTEADTFDFNVISIDITSNQRMIYVFTLDNKCVGIFSLWLNNDYVHLIFTQDIVNPLISANRDNINCKYTYLDKILNFISECFDKLDKEN